MMVRLSARGFPSWAEKLVCISVKGFSCSLAMASEKSNTAGFSSIGSGDLFSLVFTLSRLSGFAFLTGSTCVAILGKGLGLGLGLGLRSCFGFSANLTFFGKVKDALDNLTDDGDGTGTTGGGGGGGGLINSTEGVTRFVLTGGFTTGFTDGVARFLTGGDDFMRCRAGFGNDRCTKLTSIGKAGFLSGGCGKGMKKATPKTRQWIRTDQMRGF